MFVFVCVLHTDVKLNSNLEKFIDVCVDGSLKVWISSIGGGEGFREKE